MITESTQFGQLFHDVRAKVVESQQGLSAMDEVIQSIGKDPCASLGPSIRSSVESFSFGHNKLMSKDFWAGSVRSQFYANAATDGSTHRFSEGASSDDDYSSTKFEGVIDSPANREVIELWLISSSSVPLGKGFLVLLFDLHCSLDTYYHLGLPSIYTSRV